MIAILLLKVYHKIKFRMEYKFDNYHSLK